MSKKIAYLDCPTGVAGDMLLAALVDVGVPLGYLIEELGRLGLKDEFQLRHDRVHHNGQLASKIHVDLHHDHHHHHDHDHEPHHHEHTHTRCLPEIEAMILGAGLPQRAETWSLAVFRQLAEAEGAVHGIPPEQVFFHEVGAVDAIVDIVGSCLGLDWLDIAELHCSALPTGGGTVWAAHGRLPVPVPAVLKLWEMRQVPVFYNDIDRELVTPTGAAIVTTIAKSFGPVPPMVLHKVGLGAGTITLPIPNILRLWIGVAQSDISHKHHHQTHHQTETPVPQPNSITQLETQIDDLNPQAIGYIFDRLFEVGALDVFTQSIGMKKSRPGILLSVICAPDRVTACEQVIFQETTTLGIRRSVQARTALDREFQHVHTKYGDIQIKVAKQGDRVINAQPEYEDCAKIAMQHNLPWREVHQMALSLWQQGHEHEHHHPA
jgi:pyridinium-3,5-bisthiocarboxylic acid mononucleotide nickel chelatase